ncbi:MAG TPA: hypothetical protein VEH31_07730, partial [Streptosporangiaceae bacterium]|nr:hypothetical protein [Streptosporangiaceae bacterium]
MPAPAGRTGPPRLAPSCHQWTVAFPAGGSDVGTGPGEEESKLMEPELPATGDRRVDEAVSQMEDLAG